MNDKRANLKTVVRIASVAVALVSTGLVVSYVYTDIQDLSPGELSAVHSQIAELTGPENCAACHGDGPDSMKNNCLACHDAIRAQLSEAHGIHGQLKTESATRCWDCHSEHHGSDFAITNLRSFELAGISRPNEFDHAGLAFQLVGAHLEVGCDRCHLASDLSVLPVGTKRFLGLSQDCTACHEDTHRGTLGNDCASCHGQSHPFELAAEFQHTDLFLLNGSHANRKCLDCHVPNSPNSVADLLQSRSDPKSPATRLRNCANCHTSPHDSQFVARVANEFGVLIENACQACHADVHSSFSLPEATLDPKLHALTGFSLESPHDQVECKSCHGSSEENSSETTLFELRFPGRGPDDCQGCHGDPHRGDFSRGTQREKRCVDCHQRHSFAPSRFSVADHESTRFPIHGAHSDLECAACHKKTIALDNVNHPSIRSFSGETTSCAGCHNDPHFGQFEKGVFRAADCSLCHDQTDFQHPKFSGELHAKTSFPLTGAHVAVGCKGCHQQLDQTELDQLVALSPTIKFVPRVFHGTATKCVDCHADVHDGRFDQPGLPTAVQAATDCARCHTTSSFAEVRDGVFDHAAWTGFALNGAHASAECAACHRASPEQQISGRTFGLAAGSNCQDCHQDPHVGQFGNPAEIGCAKCHMESSFHELRFDHQRDSAFPLDEQHAALNCAACHKQYKLADGQLAVRYKPLGKTCADCHLPQRNATRRK